MCILGKQDDYVKNQLKIDVSLHLNTSSGYGILYSILYYFNKQSDQEASNL